MRGSPGGSQTFEVHTSQLPCVVACSSQQELLLLIVVLCNRIQRYWMVFMATGHLARSG